MKKFLGMLMSPCNLELERWRQEDPEVRAVLSYTDSKTSLNRLEFPSSHLYATQVSTSRTEMKCTMAATHTQIIATMDINVPYFHDFKINSKGSKLLGFAVTSPYTVYLEHLYPLSYPFLTLFPRFSHSTCGLLTLLPRYTPHERKRVALVFRRPDYFTLHNNLQCLPFFCLLMGTSADFITFLL